MKRILVTGANKGIGLASVENLLQNPPDTVLILGSREEKRGDERRKEETREEHRREKIREEERRREGEGRGEGKSN